MSDGLCLALSCNPGTGGECVCGGVASSEVPCLAGIRSPAGFRNIGWWLMDVSLEATQPCPRKCPVLPGKVRVELL
jgi:hypothetical protein